jgi:CMP-N-acetylneuraminic acid synthetase
MLVKIATFILARAGSKRIPQKNVRLYKGKPLVTWTLEIAWKLGYPVYVFTDFPRVVELANFFHANVRPKQFENKEGIHETGKEIVEYNKEVKADHIILLQPTSPKRDIEKIKEWIRKYIAGDYDIGFAANYVQPGFYYDAGGAPINFFEKFRDYNGNPKTHIWRESGSFYIFKSSQTEKNHIVTGENRILFHDPFDNNDIDFEEDLDE